MTQCAYMQQPWFDLLQRECRASSKAAVARRLGYSAAAIGQVLNGTGAYGTGQAGTAKLADCVLQRLRSTWPCTHWVNEGAANTIISAQRCGHLAHRAAPTSSPGDLAHWHTCQRCPKRSNTEPLPPPAAKPRKPRRARTAPPTTTTAKEL